MEHNPYQAPLAVVTDEVADAEQPFFVVTPRKLLLMQLGTGGLYGVYWFYGHWKAQNAQPGRDYWPVPRAIFSIFFAHSLFAEIRRISEQRAGAAPFASSLFATIYVSAMLASWLIGQLDRFGVSALAIQAIALLMIVPTTWALYRAQLAANHACGNDEGAANASLSAANFVWLVIGALLWLINLATLYLIATGSVLLQP